MKLYYAQGACSLAPHIVLREGGYNFTLEPVSFETKKTRDGTDFTKLNAKGYVPALQLDNNEVLTEGAVIMQYLADQKPEKNLLPKYGTFERYRANELLHFVATELHKGYSPLFNPKIPDDVKAMVKTNLAKRLGYLADQVKGDFLLGKDFSVIDAYAFTVLGWSEWTKVDLQPYPKLLGLLEHVRNRPAVHAALEAEGLTGKR